jgi:hypothetical protein
MRGFDDHPQDAAAEVVINEQPPIAVTSTIRGEAEIMSHRHRSSAGGRDAVDVGILVADNSLPTLTELRVWHGALIPEGCDGP